MKPIDIIKKLAEQAIEEQRDDGAMIAGHNGPYNDSETPTRNTAHWLITFHFMYKLTKDNKYFKALEKCGDYLLSITSRPMKATYYCRTNPNKDFANGLIGQAWAIEALVEAYKATRKKEYIDTALEVFTLHPFDSSKGLWKTVNVDGSYKGFDMTFNHQLWFAASLTILYDVHKNEKVLRELETYFQKNLKKIKTYKNGLIKHKITFNDSLINVLKNSIHTLRHIYYQTVRNKSMVYKENGYHIFNLYAFAIIQDYGFNIPLFSSKKFKKSLNYALSPKHLKSLCEDNYKRDITNLKFSFKKIFINRYGFSYNAPGFEFPYVQSVFNDKLRYNKDNNNIFSKQMDLTWNITEERFSMGTEDAITLSARIYELTRASNEYLMGKVN